MLIDLKCPMLLNLYEQTSGSMVSDNVPEGKLLISDLKGTMSSIELRISYPLTPGFSLESAFQTLARFDPAEFESSDELTAQGGVVLRLHALRMSQMKMQEHIYVFMYPFIAFFFFFINRKFSRE